MKYDIAYKRDRTLLKIAFNGQLWALLVFIKRYGTSVLATFVDGNFLKIF